MQHRFAALVLFATFAVATPSESRPPDREIRVVKGAHTLALVSDGVVQKTYRVAIGPGGPGPKQMEGDRRTPVGTYRVVGRFKGLFHQFMTLSYPNEEDRRRYADLRAAGLIPAGVGVGGGVGIHGAGGREWDGIHKESDWTLGCIALDDAEVDEVSAWARDGTRVVIAD